MLSHHQLVEILNEENSVGVKNIYLLQSDGSLVGSTGGDSSAVRSAAIAGCVWSTLQEGCSRRLPQERVDFVSMEFEQGRVALTGVSSLVLCAFAEKSMGIGILEGKLRALKETLHGPISNLLFGPPLAVPKSKVQSAKE